MERAIHRDFLLRRNRKRNPSTITHIASSIPMTIFSFVLLPSATSSKGINTNIANPKYAMRSSTTTNAQAPMIFLVCMPSFYHASLVGAPYGTNH